MAVAGVIVVCDIVSVARFRMVGCGSLFEILVHVVADVEVEVKESRAELAVSVPVAEGVQTEATENYDGNHAQEQAQ